jgi:hypothetical protein
MIAEGSDQCAAQADQTEPHGGERGLQQADGSTQYVLHTHPSVLRVYMYRHTSVQIMCNNGIRTPFWICLIIKQKKKKSLNRYTLLFSVPVCRSCCEHIVVTSIIQR